MPYVQSSNPVFGRPLLEAILSALTTVPGGALLTTPKVKLFTAGPSVISPDNLPADFTEATFNGYAEVALPTLVGPINLPSTEGIGKTAGVNFVAGSGIVVPGETILGYWIDNDATALYLAEYFATPIGIASPGDFISLDVIFGQEFNVLTI